jgi:hypothetical protein
MKVKDENTLAKKVRVKKEFGMTRVVLSPLLTDKTSSARLNSIACYSGRSFAKYSVLLLLDTPPLLDTYHHTFN